MRHTVYMMLGRESGQILCDMRSYMIKYGSEEYSKYFQCILYAHNAVEDDASFYAADAQDVDQNSFDGGIEGLYKSVLRDGYDIPKEHRSEYLNSYFADLYNRTITINNSGDSASLHLCIIMPLYEPRYWETVRSFLTAVEYIPQSYSVDLFVLPYDLAFLFEPEDALPLKIEKYKEQTRQITEQIIEAKSNIRSLSHIVMVQNCNSNGVALNLNRESFVRIVGEYALLSISHYAEMFNPSATDATRPITALGLSVLSFDKYYFVQYLLHKAYTHILDREQVLQDEVDVNRVSRIVQKVLADNVDIFNKFYECHISPKLEKGEKQDDIIADIEPELSKEIDRLTEVFQNYINDETLSLPEKRATLAQLLGEDDELLSGYMFNKKQLVIDDCSREVLDWFAVANNRLLDYRDAHNMKSAAKTPISEDGYVVTEHTIGDEIAEYAVLSDAERNRVTTASELIDNLKSIKISMRESSSYIRGKEQELQSVTTQMREHNESKKRLTEKGFIFDGQEYMLLPDIIERPCEEDYRPIENHRTQVDLRESFTSIKDQGALGACSAFTMVGIYEYILKKNHQQELDLSESFVYYNVRKADHCEHEDCGSSLYSIIVSMITEGVCLERLCPYSANPDISPSPEAYADAQSRKIVKALNVKPKIDDIRSAVAQGYPVAISLKIFDSFNADAGFVQRPSDEEIKEGRSGNHAMIVCGYSDDERVFIVRNSWGTKFGDKGYCYIPYSYIADENLLNVACIITEINNRELVVGGHDVKTAISFDMSNSLIKLNILKILIGEERQKLLRTNTLLQEYSFKYNALLQSLGNNATRSTLCDGTIRRLEQEASDLATDKVALGDKRTQELEYFDSITWKVRLYAGCFLGGYVILYMLLCYYFPIGTILFNKISYIGYGTVAVLIILMILWERKRKHDRTELDRDFQQQLSNIAESIARRRREMQVTALKSHIAGMIIDRLFKLSSRLHTKYNGMCSYVRNLCTWRQEELAADMVSPLDREPFLSLNSNKCMDDFFDKYKEHITNNIRLYSLFNEGYHIDESAIIRFKNRLKNKLVKELFGGVNEFSIYKHIVGEEKYPYVEQKYTDIHKLLRLMDEKSRIFVRTEDVADSQSIHNSSNKILFIRAELETERTKWMDLCSRNFQQAPALYPTDSNFKISLLQLTGLASSDISLLKKIANNKANVS